MSQPVPKKITATKKVGKSLANPANTPAAPAASGSATAVLETHGVALDFGDAKKGGTAKSPLVTVIARKAIRVLKGFNPRSVVGNLDELMGSIKKDGLLAPLLVRPSAKDGEFDLICGERRLRACEQLGIDVIAVQVRGDLTGKEDEARAIAVAENSEDVRTGLNAIEMGAVFAQLAKASWSVATIAAHCGVNAAKVRRCLTLMDAPEDVRKRVAAGSMSANTALEVAKLDPETRKAIADQLKGDMSAPEVRKLAKDLATESAGASDGGSAKRKEGVKRDAALIVWRSAKTKQALLQSLCHTFVNATAEDKKGDDFLELRGAIGLLLWDRGDLGDDGYLLPPANATEPADLKVLKRVDAIITKEAKRYVPPAEEGTGENAAE